MAELAETRRLEWQLLFDNMSIGVALYDAEGQGPGGNQRMLTQHGFADLADMDSSCENDGTDLRSPARRLPRRCADDWPLARALEGETVKPRNSSSGRSKPAQSPTHGTPAPRSATKHGQVIRSLPDGRGCDESRAAEAAARAHAHELQTLLDAVPTAIFIARDPACEVMTGQRPGLSAAAPAEGQ